MARFTDMWVCSYGVVNCSCCRYDEPYEYWRNDATGEIDCTRVRMYSHHAEALKKRIYDRLGNPTFNTAAYLKANPEPVKDVSLVDLLARDVRSTVEPIRTSGDVSFFYNVHSLQHERLNTSQR